MNFQTFSNIFFSDLDNTMIYSYKHDIGDKKKCVELYQGREVSYMTDSTLLCLGNLMQNGQTLFVPVTTRTREQYSRILFPHIPDYALCCNGGVLLIDNVADENWYAQSLSLIQNCAEELLLAKEFLEKEPTRTMDVRFIDDLFVFTKSSQPEDTLSRLKNILNPELMDVFTNHVKIYAIPKVLNKGTAIQRFLDYFFSPMNHPTTYAAGDSLFDIPMLLAADVAFAPSSLLPDDFYKTYHNNENQNKQSRKTSALMRHDGPEIFSDWILHNIIS